jgi:2-amino-4-hydroxy-6-hydroxymethyldihydropteridine diphosphokinase
VPRVYIALGSNLEPELRLRRAARALRTHFPDVRFSACYRNPSQSAAPPTPGAAGAEDYVNSAAAFETELLVPELRELLRDIEFACGRRRDAPGCALDLDLLWYGDVVGMTAAGPLPRPELLRRSYQLGPLAELAPGLRHPLAGSTVAQLWELLRPTQPTLVHLPLDLNESAASAA